MAAPDPGDVDAARAALSRVRDELLGRAEVISVEVARAHEVDDPTAVCLRVVVGVGADRAALPSSVDGIPVEVVEGQPPGLE